VSYLGLILTDIFFGPREINQIQNLIAWNFLCDMMLVYMSLMKGLFCSCGGATAIYWERKDEPYSFVTVKDFCVSKDCDEISGHYK